MPVPILEVTETLSGLDDLYRRPDATGAPWVRGSFVMSLDGAICGPDGRSGTLANAVDRAVFPVLRRTSDLILVGAGTARIEGYRVSKVPIAVVTGSGDLPESLPLIADRKQGDPPLLVITREQATISGPVQGVAEVLRCGHDVVDLHEAIGALGERGYGIIHCEGGPRLLGDLLAAELLDEVLLTIVPVLMGAGSARHLMGVPGLEPRRWHFTQVLEQDGTLLVRAARLPIEAA